MNLFARLNVLQQGRRFKWIASAVLVSVWLLAMGWLWVTANRPDAAAGQPVVASQSGTDQAGVTPGPFARFVDAGPMTLVKVGAETAVATMRTPEGTAVVAAVSFGFVAGGLLVIWLGLGLSYLAILLVGWGVAWPLAAWPPTARLGQVLLGAVPLTLAFLVLMQALRLALGAPIPLFAVAKNVLIEAVRMKVSLVFIVMLILMMALVPGMLTEDQPLRYRVQQWLSYGVGLSYTVLALLTLFLSAATVAFEQRDRVIWQTMTKPVPHWQYVLGKWVGVMSLNAVLLAVSSTGVFLFTEYLSHQRARGETAYLVREDGRRSHPDDPNVRQVVDIRMNEVKQRIPAFKDTPERREIMARQVAAEFMSEDRRILENQVLSARVGIRPDPPILDEEAIKKELDERVAQVLADNPGMRETRSMRKAQEKELLTQVFDQARSIAPGGRQIFVFSGLGEVKKAVNRGELTLRYKINAGSNNPSAIYKVMFVISGYPREVTSALKVMNSMSIEPEVIDDEGKLVLEVHSHPDNGLTMSFPPDGLEVLYRVGGYEANFFRVMTTIWIKLGFIAAVAIAAATFLNFPVACLVAVTVLFAAESAGFLKESLEVFVSYDESTKTTNYVAVVVRAIAVPVSAAFERYADLKPGTSLVEGRLLGWPTMIQAAGLIGAWTLGALTLGWAAFRRRELAFYSGN